MRIESNIYPRQVVSVDVQNEPFVAPVETNSIGSNPPFLPAAVGRRRNAPARFPTSEVIEADAVVQTAQTEIPEEISTYYPAKEILKGEEDTFVDIVEILNIEEREEVKRSAALQTRKKMVENNYHPDLSPKSINLSIYA